MRIFVIFIALTVFVVPSAHAQDDSFILYGNETSLANNIVITIDDCSIESNVRWAYDILNNRGLTATFFPNTRNIIHQDPQLWRDIVAAGMEIGYHTRFHMSGLTPRQLDDDFAAFTQEIREILDDPNYSIHYIRPPRGVWDENWLSWGASRGLVTVRWNYTLPATEPSMAYNITMNRQRGGSILLMHTGLADLEWLQANIDTMLYWETYDGEPLRPASISVAMRD